jgi:periodic tryptophan protein 1
MSMITATTWVPRGFAAPFPSKYEFDEDEYDRISKLANLQLEDAKEELEEAQAEAEAKANGTSTKSSKEKDDEYVWKIRTTHHQTHHMQGR